MKRLFLPLAACLALAACSSSSSEAPPPNLAVARTTIQGLDPQLTSRYAAGELTQARDRLDLAEAAWRQEEYTNTRRYADEALVLARLAQARTQAAQAEEARNDVARAVQTLEAEVGATTPERLPAQPGATGDIGVGAGAPGPTTGSPRVVTPLPGSGS